VYPRSLIRAEKFTIARMPTPRRGFSFASALLIIAACRAPSGPADTAGKAEAAPKVDAPATEPEPEPEPEPEGNDGFSSPEPAQAAPLPAWFSPSAFEHVAIIRQDDRSNRLPTGQAAIMIVLELPAGTTPETCLANAKAKLGESIPDLAAPTTTPQGYLTITGKTSAYEYTVVCGVAKDKPTMFLSVVQ
jgi:hypothetical protein